MAYVTDTTAAADANYRSAIAGVDLLLHECYYPDTMAPLATLTGHSVITPVARLARRQAWPPDSGAHQPVGRRGRPSGIGRRTGYFPGNERGPRLDGSRVLSFVQSGRLSLERGIRQPFDSKCGPKPSAHNSTQPRNLHFPVFRAFLFSTIS